MIKRPNTNAQRLKRHKRVRAKISGTPECPRLNVFRSEANIYAQVIDDVNGVTLCFRFLPGQGHRRLRRQHDRCFALWASWWLSAPWPRALRTSCLTAAAICTTAVCRLWLRAPVRAA